MLYAIIDIETTGGNAQYHKITDIAIFLHNGECVIDQFHSLINPQRPIPKNITYLTGITNAMVADAPIFEDLSSKILEITENAIFIAHNVNFDYSFVKQEFQAIGIQFERKKLCTVRLSRKLVPGLSSYSLGNICSHFQITIEDRHRALGDATATTVLFQELLNRDNNLETINYSLKKSSKENNIASNVDPLTLKLIPNSTGIYRFHDKKGDVIYVGKAQNLKQRVNEHFSGQTHTKSRNLFGQSIFNISYEETGSELIALLLENEEIKKHFPRYNRTNKTFELNTGIYRYQDQLGYERISIGKAGKRDQPYLLFTSEAEALNFLLKLTNENKLCLRLMGIINGQNKCTNHSQSTSCKVCMGIENVESYNLRLNTAIADIQEINTYIIMTKGRNSDERGVILIEKGKFLGYTYQNNENNIYHLLDLKQNIKKCYDTQDSQKIIKQYLPKVRLTSTDPIKIYELER